MKPSFQTIGWTDIVISEGVRDPNDYNLGDNDPYNTDDDVVDDLFDQWLQSRGEDMGSNYSGEDLALSFELGAQVAMEGKYKGNKQIYRVPVSERNPNTKAFWDARTVALREFGLSQGTHSIGGDDIIDAFNAGYQAFSKSSTPMIDATPKNNVNDDEDPLAKLAQGMSNHFRKR